MEYAIYKHPRLYTVSHKECGVDIDLSYVRNPSIGLLIDEISTVRPEPIHYMFIENYAITFHTPYIFIMEFGPSLIVKMSKNGIVLSTEEYGLLNNDFIKYSEYEIHPQVISNLVDKHLGIKNDT